MIIHILIAFPLFFPYAPDITIIILNSFRNIIQQSFGIFPSEAGIGDGFAVNMICTANFLVAFNNVAFNHDTLDKLADVIGVLTAA